MVDNNSSWNWYRFLIKMILYSAQCCYALHCTDKNVAKRYILQQKCLKGQTACWYNF